MSKQSKSNVRATFLVALAGIALVTLSADLDGRVYVLMAGALLGAAAVIGCGLQNARLWLMLMLGVKVLYVADLGFAMSEGRALRYVQSDYQEAFRVRAEALLIIAAWLASFVSAFACGNRMQIVRPDPEPGRKRTAFAAILLMFLSQVSFFLIVWRVGGVREMAESMSSRYAIYHGIGALRVLVATGAVACALTLLGGRRRTAWAAAVPVFLELSLLGGRSYALFSAVFPLAMIWLSARRTLPWKRLVLLSITALLFVTVMGEYRSAQLTGRYGETSNPVVRMAADTGGADNFPSLLVLLKGGYVGFDGGKVVAAGLLSPIPRAIWPGKPVADEAAALGVVLADAEDVNWGLPIGPHGLAFYTAGRVAVPIFGVISGMFAGWLLRQGSRNVFWAAVAPFALLLAPDMFSPAVGARILYLLGLAIAGTVVLRVRVSR